MKGFLVGDPEFGGKWAAKHHEQVAGMLKGGKLKTTFCEWHGIDQSAKALVAMLKGQHFGKAILSLKS